MENSTFSPLRNPGTVLLIEDEDFVMDVNSSLLRKLGCQVLEAKTGKEAIEIVDSFNGDIDCAILDIELPDQEGKDIYSILMEKIPSLKVIVCSGYSINGPAQSLLKAGAQGFLAKPFRLTTLSEMLNEVFG